MAKKKRKKASRKKARRKKSTRRNPRKRATRRKTARRPKKRKVRANRKRRKSPRKRKVRANRKRRKPARKRKVSANKKRSRRKTRKKATRRRKPVRANRKRKTRKRRSTRRNKARRALPTLRNRRRRKPSRRKRRARRNTMWPMAANPILRNPLGRKSAAKLAWRQRKRKRKGYASAKKRGGRYPVARNPRNIAQAFKANLAGIFNKRMLVDAGQMTIGSVGAPVLAASLSKLMARTTGKALPMSGIAGYGVRAVSGVVLATGAAMVSKDASLSKNVLLGTIGGIFADIAKKRVLPMIMGGSAAAAPAAVTAPETAAAAGVSGLRGPRQDLARELALSGINDYATGQQIIRATLEEEF